MKMSQTILSFLKVGTIGFGGGSALIPVIEKELVQDQKAISEAEYLKHTVVANITPGALPVKLGATCGYELNGMRGAIAGAYAVALPGTLLTILFMALFSVLGDDILNYFNYASVGITAFIVFLLVGYIVRTVSIGHKSINLALCFGAFLLTGGKEIREILSLLLGLEPNVLGTPLFDISTIDLIIATFFVIIILEKLRTRAEILIAIGVSVIYTFSVGKMGRQIGLAQYKSYYLAFMIFTIILIYAIRKNKTKKAIKIPLSRTTILLALLFIAIPVVLGFIVYYIFFSSLGSNIFEFLNNIAASTITSFGGGEAYVSVADGIFVQGEIVEPESFYTRLVPIANSLPGPILVKIAAGLGYLVGAENVGMVAGIALSVAASTVAIGVCCAIAVLALGFYDSVKQWELISNIKIYILPVICGMLISTSAAMLYESMKITGEKGIHGIISLPSICIVIFGLFLLHRHYKLHDIALLFISASVSLLTLIML